MFTKKDKQDAIHRANIKRGITSHFARTLKVLQQKYLQPDADDYIYSDDFSNNLCSALEAAFLHGLKDSVTQKMSTYVGLSAPQDQSPYVNFWSICANFTHKDVVTQVRGLSQINTEIGLCRAWIRMALNDGLMESYLHSMLVDKKTLTYYYHSHSYLRDHEQPGILKNYLTGLMSLNFKLSFNSSVLNIWNNASLQLAGLLDGSHVPGAILDSRGNLASPSDGRSYIVAEDMSRAEDDQSDEPIVATRHTQQSSHSTGLARSQDAQAMFSSIRDVEEIRRIANAHNTSSRLSFSPSEGSTSSLVSCPDPSSFGASRDEWIKGQQAPYFAISPALYPRADSGSHTTSAVGVTSEDHAISEVISCLSDFSAGETDLEDSQASTITIVDNVDSTRPETRPRSRRVAADEELNLSHKSLAMSASPIEAIHEPDPSQFKTYHPAVRDTESPPRHANSPSVSSRKINNRDSQEEQTLSNNGGNDSGNTLKVMTSSTTSSSHADDTGITSPSRHQARGRTYDEICATLPPIKLEPLEQEAILRKVLEEIDEKADKERAERYRNKCGASPLPAEFRDDKPNDEGNTVNSATPLPNTSSSNANAQKTSNDINKVSSVITDQSSAQGGGNTPERNCLSTFDKKAEGSSKHQDGAGSPQHLDASQEAKGKSLHHDHHHQNDKGSPEHHSKKPDGEGQSAQLSAKQDEEGSRPEHHTDMQQGKESSQTQDAVQDDGVASPQGFDDSQERHHSASTGFEESFSSEASIYASGNYGNSLGSMTGWSSQIERNKGRNMERQRSRAESFASMLKSYAGQHQVMSTTLDQVLEGLPSEEDDVDANKHPTQSSNTDEAAAEELDSDLDEFEILSPLPSSAHGLQNVDSSRMIYLFRVPREHGLSHQNFTCRGCSRPIGIIYGPPRLCEFDGGLYCFECHENNETHVPSFIVYDWDFSKKKVCIANCKFLQELEHQALYDIAELNPKLEAHVPELKSIKALRKQLRYLKSYLFSCSQKMAELLRQKVWPREHLYDDCTTYSVSDFFQVQSGGLQRFIKDLVKFASKHVYECSLCRQKGFICEICRNPQIIYPFEVDTTARCDQCKSTYHLTCMTENVPCPKCERWGKRVNGNRPNNVVDDVNHPEDYGTSPPGL